MWRKRQLIITDQPRISYKNLDNDYKGDVIVSPDLRAELKGNKDFILITPVRTYHFKEILGSGQKWVDTVNKLVKDSFKS